MVTIFVGYWLGLLNKLPLPAVDLIGMDVELFRQYFYGLSFVEGFQAKLRFKGRSESSTGCRAHFLAFNDE